MDHHASRTMPKKGGSALYVVAVNDSMPMFSLCRSTRGMSIVTYLGLRLFELFEMILFVVTFGMARLEVGRSVFLEYRGILEEE